MRFILLATLPLLFFFSACSGDSSISGNATVKGGWKLDRATRNNMETSLLDGLHFDFQEGGTLVTNLMGNEADGTYEWNDTQITTKGISLPLTYTIMELTDSTLNLRSKYQGYQFDFELVKK